MRTIFIGVLLVGSAAAGISQARAEDPAMTVCEMAIKDVLKAPSTYKRIALNIEKNAVTITFDAVNAFNAPLRDKMTCTYSLEEDGKFALDPFDLPDMQRRLADQKALLDKATTAEEAGAVKVALMQLSVQFIAAAKQVEATSKEATQLGIYPIDPSETALKPIEVK